MKRLVVGVFVSALTMFGVAPAASAATSGEVVVKVQKAKKPKLSKVIDWDAPPADGGGVSTQRIDWD